MEPDDDGFIDLTEEVAGPIDLTADSDEEPEAQQKQQHQPAKVAADKKEPHQPASLSVKAPDISRKLPARAKSVHQTRAAKMGTAQSKDVPPAAHSSELNLSLNAGWYITMVLRHGHVQSLSASVDSFGKLLFEPNPEEWSEPLAGQHKTSEGISSRRPSGASSGDQAAVTTQQAAVTLLQSSPSMSPSPPKAAATATKSAQALHPKQGTASPKQGQHVQPLSVRGLQ